MSKTWSYLLIAVWTATLFAGFVPWPLQAAVFVIPVSIVLAGLAHSAPNALWRPPGFAALAGLLVFLVVQCIPLPPSLLRLVASGHERLYGETIWALRPGAWMPLAVTLKPAVFGFLQLWVVGGVFWMTTQTGAHHGDLGKLVRRFGLTVGGVALVLIGTRVFGWWRGAEPALFLSVPHEATVAFAALVPLVLCCHLYAKPRRAYGPWTTRLRQALRHPGNYQHNYLLLSAALMCATVILSGAVRVRIAMVCGMILVSLFALVRQSSRSSSTAVVMLSLVVLVVVGLGSRQVDQRIDVPSASTPATSFASRTLIKDFLWFGSGPGSLSALENRYTRIAASPKQTAAEQPAPPVILIEGGLVGIVLTLWFWVSVFLAGCMGGIKRHNRLATFLLPGILSGLIVSFVSGIDPTGPSFLWPGIPGYFLAGLLIAVGCFSSAEEPDASVGHLLPLERLALFFIAGVSLLAGVGYVAGQGVLRSLPSASAAVIAHAEGENLRAEPHLVLKSRLMFDPLQAENWFAAGKYWADQQADDRAYDLFSTALRLDPLAGAALYRSGAILAERGYAEAGNKLMLAGLRNAPLDARLQRDHLLFLLAQGKNRQALENLTKLLLLSPDQTGFWLRYLESMNLTREQWQDYLPHRAQIYWQFGEFLASKQSSDTASIYLEAAKLAAEEPWVPSELFRQIAAHFVDRNDYESAIEVLRYGMLARPKDLPLFLFAGDLYQRIGITYRAREVYRKALLLDPENAEIRNRLDGLP